MTRALVAALFACLLAIPGAPIGPTPVSAADGVVRAVLFFRPYCPHCYQVVNTDLPPIQERHGERLQVAFFDVSTTVGSRLYEAAIAEFEIPNGRLGVPTLIIDDTVLVGSFEIPELLPALVEDALTRGGTDWPAIPGLAEALPTRAPTVSERPHATPLPATGEPMAPGISMTLDAIVERFGSDPIGNGISVVVLTGLLLTLAGVASMLPRARLPKVPEPPPLWIVPLALAGLAVATYLGAVELTDSTAVCGPVGDCNAVHASTYSRFLGVPVGVLGAAGYLAILGSWIIWRRGSSKTARAGQAGLVLLAAIGTLFSAYLTFLEPFVIGATCGWCLLSAVTMGLLFLLAARSITVVRGPLAIPARGRMSDGAIARPRR